MPNWVYNNLTISKKVWDAIKGKDEDGNETFTFNTIIQKPAILDEMTACSNEVEAVVYYKTNRLTDGRTAEEVYEELKDCLGKMNMFYNLGTVERAFERLSEVDKDGHICWQTPDELLEFGKKYWECYEQYGHCDWYSWSIENWGTKWDACDVEVEEDKEAEEVMIFFTTAWDYPQPIFDKLIEMFPEENFFGRCEEEGHNFPTFEWEYTKDTGLESWDVPDDDEDEEDEENDEETVG